MNPETYYTAVQDEVQRTGVLLHSGQRETITYNADLRMTRMRK